MPFSLTNVYVSLHTASPADNGANEVSGGSYARLQPDWTAAATLLPGLTVGGEGTRITVLSDSRGASDARRAVASNET